MVSLDLGNERERVHIENIEYIEHFENIENFKHNEHFKHVEHIEVFEQFEHFEYLNPTIRGLWNRFLAQLVFSPFKMCQKLLIIISHI